MKYNFSRKYNKKCKSSHRKKHTVKKRKVRNKIYLQKGGDPISDAIKTEFPEDVFDLHIDEMGKKTLYSIFNKENNNIMCTTISITNDTLYLEQLDKCKFSGSVILDKLDKISRLLGLHKIELFDASEIKDENCHNSTMRIDLKLLYILTNGQSWYNYKGYRNSTFDAEFENNSSIISINFKEFFLMCININKAEEDAFTLKRAYDIIDKNEIRLEVLSHADKNTENQTKMFYLYKEINEHQQIIDEIRSPDHLDQITKKYIPYYELYNNEQIIYFLHPIISIDFDRINVRDFFRLVKERLKTIKLEGDMSYKCAMYKWVNMMITIIKKSHLIFISYNVTKNLEEEGGSGRIGGGEEEQ